MNEAVIVSTARTPIGKAYKGAFNNTHGATLAGPAVKKAVEVSGIDPSTVEDCLIGCAMPEGATGGNIARQIAIRGGLPVTTAGALTSSVGTTAQTVLVVPGTNVMTSSIAGVTTGVVIPIGSANLGMTSTVQAMGSEYTLKLIKIPETNLLTGSTGSPSLFTWVDVNDNVTAETWTDVETEDSTESWSNV